LWSNPKLIFFDKVTTRQYSFHHPIRALDAQDGKVILEDDHGRIPLSCHLLPDYLIKFEHREWFSVDLKKQKVFAKVELDVEWDMDPFCVSDCCGEYVITIRVCDEPRFKLHTHIDDIRQVPRVDALVSLWKCFQELNRQTRPSSWVPLRWIEDQEESKTWQ
jgi:hypothetical protein